MTRLILIRHGESNATVQRIVGGPRACTGLSDLGRQQAAALAERLARTGELRADVLIASTYPRAIETADAVRSALGGLEVQQIHDVGEHFPGPEVDGMTFEEYATRYGLTDWNGDPYATGFPGGETIAEFQHRIARAFTAIVAEHPGRTIVVVCHGGVIDAVLRRFLQAPPTGLFEVHTVNTSITEFFLVEPNKWRLIRYNDAGHLAGLPRETPRERRVASDAALMELRPVVESNLREVLDLRVWPSQEKFVSPVWESLVQAHHGSRRAWYRAAYIGDKPVGFVMLTEPHQPTETFPHDAWFLWRLLVAGPYQRGGYGRRLLELVCEHVQADTTAPDELYTTWVPGDDGPEEFYLRFGFEATGRVVDGMVEARLGSVARAVTAGGRPSRADVVVLGAGSAGCVLASRLSEDGGRTVALVEAGPDGATTAVDGLDFYTALDDPQRTWPDLLVRRAEVQAPSVYRRGRGLGGSSAVNAMVALPGLRADYERWEQLGAIGWGADVLAARFADLRAGATPATLADATPERFTPFERAVTEALTSTVGVDRVDPWATDADGWFPATWTARTDPDTGRLRRWSTADAYLGPDVRARTNLHVVADAGEAALAVRGGDVTGVTLADGHRIHAGEVVVAAGAIHSPLVLARAGLGGPGLGTQLRDHAAIAFFVAAGAGGAVLGTPDGPLDRPPATLLARFSSGEAAGDLQLLVLAPAGPWPAMAGTAVVMVSLMQVASHGTVTPAGIEQRMLSDATDRRRLRAGVRALVALLLGPNVRTVAPDVFCDDQGTHASVLAGLDDAGLDAWMLAHLADYVHVAGSCRMGPPDAAGSVVGPDLALLGHAGVRVCDASVFPDLPRANTHVTTVAVAEELAARLVGH